MRVLIVDDSLDKISELSKVIYEIDPQAHIETCENISNAILCLTEGGFFNLAVIDLFLPLRKNEEPKKNGGEKLLNEIYRKKQTLKIPNYIIGFSQYEENSSSFSPIWNVIRYCANNSTNWKNSLKTLLNHIDSTKFVQILDEIVLPTIFVEGLTDQYYIKQAIEIFFADSLDRVKVISQKNAGANWVANQIPIWAMKLQKDIGGSYIKAIGLLDSDEAGNIAKSNIENRNLTDNEKQCCTLYQIKPNYNLDILEFYQKKCKIEIEIESLFPLNILNYAESNNWLEHRSKTFIEAPTDWKQHKETSIQYICKKDIPIEKQLYLKKVKMDKKIAFYNYVNSLKDKESVYINFKPLVNDLLKKIQVL